MTIIVRDKITFMETETLTVTLIETVPITVTVTFTDTVTGRETVTFSVTDTLEDMVTITVTDTVTAPHGHRTVKTRKSCKLRIIIVHIFTFFKVKFLFHWLRNWKNIAILTKNLIYYISQYQYLKYS